MAVFNMRGFNPIVWIPPIYTANFKVTVEDNDGTVYDITDILIDARFKDAATKGIGNFEFTIPNANETYTSLFTGNEIVRLYIDYAEEATTLRFKGRIEKPANTNHNLRCSGRSEALFVFDKTVNKSFIDEDCADILKELYSAYGEARFDTSDTSKFVSSTGVTLTKEWQDVPFWQVTEEIMEACGHDHYIDANDDVNLFPAGSRTNTGEGMVHEYNLIEVGEFAPDNQQVKNKVIVYGGENEGIQTIYTAQSVAEGDPVRPLLHRDDSIVTDQQAKETGDFLLSVNKDPPEVGDVTSVMLATIQPGEKIRISSPENNLPPAYYLTTTYEHTIGTNGIRTKVEVNKRVRRFSEIYKKRIERENRTGGANQNPFEMRYTYNHLFEQDSGVHTNTEITNSVLKLQDGETSGNWVSEIKNEDANIEQVNIIVTGETLTGASYEVSANGGVSYESVTPGTRKTISTSIGTQIKIRVTLSNADTQIDSLSLQYIKAE